MEPIGSISEGQARELAPLRDDPDRMREVYGQRRHQSKGSRAASWALTMLQAGERENGKWNGARGRALIRPESGMNPKAWANLLSQAGTIADHQPDLLYQVRDDEMTQNGPATVRGDGAELWRWSGHRF